MLIVVFCDLTALSSVTLLEYVYVNGKNQLPLDFTALVVSVIGEGAGEVSL